MWQNCRKKDAKEQAGGNTSTEHKEGEKNKLREVLTPVFHADVQASGKRFEHESICLTVHANGWHVDNWQQLLHVVP